jgi:hypothetical protein
MKNIFKLIILLIVGLLLTFLFWKYPAPHDRILNIQNYLITVGGIISAFVIAYLSAKIFSLKTDRENRQVKIDKLSERLTAFRQLLYFVMKSNKFWVKYNDIAKFKKEYPGFDYDRLRGSGEDPLRQKFWLDEEHISQNTISLYSAMEAIYDSEDNVLIPWAYEKAVSVRYSIEDLSKYHEPCNQIWYYLDGRYGKHGSGLFNDEGLSVLFYENYKELVAIADIKHKGKDFHRLVLADLGTKFYEYIIPKMAELIAQNTGVPKGILKTFYSLLSIMLFGVIFPIILQSISVSNCLDTTLTLSFVNLTTLSLLYFLFEFYSLIYDEVHTNKKSSSQH